MKIFFPLEVYYPSQAGGPANTIHWIVKNLPRDEFTATIVTTDKGIQPDVELNKWTETEGGKAMFVKTRILYFPLVQSIIAVFYLFRADLIHISSLFFPTSFVSGIVARIFRKPIVWSPRGEVDVPALSQSRVRKALILWLLKRIVGRYPVFHSTCDEETQYIKMQFGADVCIVQIPNYIDIPSLVEHLGKEKYLLYIGRVNPKKAIDNLLRGLAVCDEFLNSDFVLKIAGKGTAEYENYLKNLVSELGLAEKVIFIGQVEGDEKQKLYSDAYFTFMPSHTENFGNVVLESLAQQTPVVASKNSPWRQLEAERIGFWVENSPEELARVTAKILRMERTEYEGYRGRSRDFVVREFDIVTNIDKWIDLYKSLA